MNDPQKKIERLEIRVTPGEKARIALEAQSKNLTMSDYLRGTAIPQTKKS